MNNEQLGLFRDPTGAEYLDAGVKSVEERNAEWLEDGIAMLRVYLQTVSDFTGEDFRAWWNGPEPAHVNAWGALLLSAAQRGIIRKTGRYIPARSPMARARIIAVWERA